MTNDKLEQALKKGNRFFARKNFLLAKKEFEIALQLRPGEELRKKIKVCAAENARNARQETIKRGRKLEKKGKDKEALHCFEQAFKTEKEEWLEKKISVLREKLSLSKLSSSMNDAENSGDLEVRIAAYDKLLEAGQGGSVDKNELQEKKAVCLVKLGRYAEATALYETCPPGKDAARYFCGYAYAKTGRFARALAHWEEIKTRPADLLPQYERLLPFAQRELAASRVQTGYAAPYRCACRLAAVDSSARLKAYQNHFKGKYIEELWANGQYTEVLELLRPHPDKINLGMLGLFARVYLKAAENDSRHLEQAITFGLTALYNDAILSSLSIHKLSEKNLSAGIETIRKALLDSLEAMVNRYERAGGLSKRQLAYWRLEKRLIHTLSTLENNTEGQAIFPCTPLFASKFGLSEQIFSLLSEGGDDKDKEDFLEVSAYFSSAGESLVLMEVGEEEKALRMLSDNVQKSPSDNGLESELSAYCRQRVYLRYGIKKALQGEPGIKKYFLDTLPLLKRYPHYVDELTELSFSDLEDEACMGLAEVMDTLSGHIEDPKFREAAAHILGIKAVILRNQGLNRAAFEKQLQRALSIYPDSEMARTALERSQTARSFDEINKAFKQQNLGKAVDIIARNRDPELIDYFFETVERWFDQSETWDKKDRLAALHDFHRHCCYVNKKHPLTEEIADEIKLLEDK
ncbi:MAG: hypothetical protein GY862_13935 [Gammaproteobacteria bacterium]|nr:hypothetical protein [Gammaproteobacteria bacterium]